MYLVFPPSSCLSSPAAPFSAFPALPDQSRQFVQDEGGRQRREKAGKDNKILWKHGGRTRWTRKSLALYESQYQSASTNGGVARRGPSSCPLKTTPPRARRPRGGGTVCLARSTPHTGGSGAQGLWSVIHSQTTSEPLPKGDARARQASLNSEASGPVSRRARRLLGLTWAVPVGAGSES